MSAPILHCQRLPIPAYLSYTLPRLHARCSGSSGRTCTGAKRAATQQTPQETEEKRNPADLLTPYEPLDDEGNPWWSPPDSDVWEGGAWEWLGRGGAVALPTLLAVAVVIGLFSAANYAVPHTDTPEPTTSETMLGQADNGLDLMLGNDGDDSSSSRGSQEIQPF